VSWEIKLKSIIAYLEMLAVFVVLSTDGIIKYILFLLWVGIICISSQKRIQAKYFIISIPALFCAIWGTGLAIVNSSISVETVKEIGFCLAPALGVSLIFCCKNEKKIRNYIDSMFFAIVTIFLINGIRNFSVLDLMESSYAFIFGVYVIYYLYYKNHKLLIISSLCTLLADKRIVWGAVFVGVAIVVILFRKKYNSKNFYKNAKHVIIIIGTITTVCLLLYVYLIRSNFMSDFMLTHGINPMGRLDVWDWFSKYYSFSPTFIGIGLGNVKEYLITLGNTFFDRLHNDILMYYIELGFVGSAIYFYLHFYIQIRLLKHRVINYKQVIILITFTIYTFVCYCTDNISIYIHYLFPYYVLISTCIFYPPDKEKHVNEVFNRNDLLQR